MPGELIIRGPNVMLGYWNRPEETAQVLRNGWFYSGDIGMVDEEGYFYIVDRSKDMINVSGLKVYPAEVENVIYQHPAVAEVAVYGVADAVLGEMVKAHIVLRAEQTLNPGEIMAFCHKNLATFKVPRKIEFVETLPKSPTGKVLKRVLREQG
jgi:long-chain acyl-CoA synthetase